MGTPGRVGSLLETGVLQPGMMRTLVLDEADQLMTDSFVEDVRCAASGKQQEQRPISVYHSTPMLRSAVASGVSGPLCKLCDLDSGPATRSM